MWSLTPIDHPATQAAADCLEEVFGERPVYLREGGSIPAGATFSSVLGLPVVLLGFTQPDDQIHAPERERSASTTSRAGCARSSATGSVSRRSSNRSRLAARRAVEATHRDHWSGAGRRFGWCRQAPRHVASARVESLAAC